VSPPPAESPANNYFARHVTLREQPGGMQQS